jgi:hypothetical protein
MNSLPSRTLGFFYRTRRRRQRLPAPICRVDVILTWTGRPPLRPPTRATRPERAARPGRWQLRRNGPLMGPARPAATSNVTRRRTTAEPRPDANRHAQPAAVACTPCAVLARSSGVVASAQSFRARTSALPETVLSRRRRNYVAVAVSDCWPRACSHRSFSADSIRARESLSDSAAACRLWNAWL